MAVERSKGYDIVPKWGATIGNEFTLQRLELLKLKFDVLTTYYPSKRLFKGFNVN